MMRSLYSGVAGLQNHQIRMDVIGNNIANVNTIGFKKGRVNFQDIISQTMAGAARPTEEVGGVNPRQVGLGMNVATIDTLFVQGAFQTTGVNSDIAIEGNGFFVLKNGENLMYTRAGAFGLDEDGTLVNPANGMRVQGWMAEEIDGEIVLQTARDVEDLIIPVGSKDLPKATSLVELRCNLDKRLEVITPDMSDAAAANNTWTLNKTIYDGMGIQHELRMNFTKVAGEENQWQAEVLVDPSSEDFTQADVNPVLGLDEEGDYAGNTFIIEFDNNGAISRVIDETGAEFNEDELTINLDFNVMEAREEVAGEPVTQNVTIKLGTVGSSDDSMTQSADESSSKAFRQDGYGMGYLETYRIDDSGQITGVYSNGAHRVIGQIAMASFTNPGGLEKAGESTYIETNNSGDADIGTSRVAGKGKMIAGALEMSNVDLAEQFTDMIVTQRGFQANSRSITTSDQMLQELLTLKR